MPISAVLNLEIVNDVKKNYNCQRTATNIYLLLAAKLIINLLCLLAYRMFGGNQEKGV